MKGGQGNDGSRKNTLTNFAGSADCLYGSALSGTSELHNGAVYMVLDADDKRAAVMKRWMIQ